MAGTVFQMWTKQGTDVSPATFNQVKAMQPGLCPGV